MLYNQFTIEKIFPFIIPTNHSNREKATSVMLVAFCLEIEKNLMKKCLILYNKYNTENFSLQINQTT